MKSFRANGKILLSAEYSVLRGALALAVPTVMGQSISIQPHDSQDLHWFSLDTSQKEWFSATFSSDLKVVSTTDKKSAKTLQKILLTAQQLNPKFQSVGHRVETRLEFDRHWGLGSSSTLIALIAQWAQVEALELFFQTLTGSGYDVACALVNHPITYQLNERTPAINKIHFLPNFKQDLHFVYLGQKQRSDQEVVRFSQKAVSSDTIDLISDLTNKMIAAGSIQEFENTIMEHEELTGKIIGLPPIRKAHFQDYPGAIKSLGAWGGDFIMATRLNEAPDYFSTKGYTTILTWNELIGI